MSKISLLSFLMILLLHEVCSDNYIVVYFLKTNILYYGFANAKRESGDIEYLLLRGDNKRSANEGFGINPLINYYPMKVYFNKKITSLESYFDIAYDGNTKNIISLDFSNFDSSEITSSELLCKGCENLKYVNFKNFNTPKLLTMSNMFYGCSKLISIDLSNFVTSNVNNYTNLFSGCSSLRLIDISGFNFGADSNIFNGMFDGLDSLRYINLKNIEINTPFTSYINQCSLESKELLIVCEDSEILTSSNNKVLLCCDFNIESNTCNPTNYTITILYWYEQVSYNEGFITSDYRKDVFFINYNGRTYGGNNQLIIESTPSPLQICFSKPIVNLAHFFDSESNLAKADFSGLNSPDIVEMSYLFYNCQNLFEVNFNNFNTQSVTKMDFMFYSCGSLNYLNLSSFNTEKVTTMESMFDGCYSLNILIIRNFVFTNVNNTNNAFRNVNKLKYIDIFNIKTNQDFIDQLSNIFNGKSSDSYVCQRNKIFTGKNIINFCCLTIGDELETCTSDNYIILTYGKTTTYEKGFVNNNFRNNISFLFYNGAIFSFSLNYPLTINENTNLEINIPYTSEGLSHFFDIEYDPLLENVVSIDFSHLDISYITDMSFLFN